MAVEVHANDKYMCRTLPMLLGADVHLQKKILAQQSFCGRCSFFVKKTEKIAMAHSDGEH